MIFGRLGLRAATGTSLTSRRSITAGPGLATARTSSRWRPALSIETRPSGCLHELLEAAGHGHGEREHLVADAELDDAAAAPVAAADQRLRRRTRRACLTSNSQEAQSSARTQKPSVFLCGSGSKRSITPWTSAVQAGRVIVPSAAWALGA